MKPVGLLIEFKDGRVKDANLGMATAARGPNHQLVALVVDGSAADAKAVLELYGVSHIVNISTGRQGWDPVARAGAVVAALHEFGITDLIGLTAMRGNNSRSA